MLRVLSKALQGVCASKIQVSKTPLEGVMVEEPLPCDGKSQIQPDRDVSHLFSPQLVLCLGPKRSRLALEPRRMGWVKSWCSGCV